jgi:hypothetical protein
MNFWGKRQGPTVFLWESLDEGGREECEKAIRTRRDWVVWSRARPAKGSRVSHRHRTLKSLDMSNLIITSGSEGSELSEAYMAERVLAQWEAPSWRPVSGENFRM